MERASIFSIPIWLRIFIAILLVSFLSAAWIVVTSISGAVEINENNLQAYVEESGQGIAQAIRSDFNTILRQFESFIGNADNLRDTQRLILTRDIASFAVRHRELVNNFPVIATNELFADRPELFNGAWILHNDGEVLASVVAQGSSGADIPSIESPDPYPELTRNVTNSQQTLTVEIVEDENQQVTILLYRQITEVVLEEQLVGFVVVQVNLEALVTNKFTRGNADLPRYSFAIIGDNIMLAQEDLFADELIFTSTIGVSRANNNLTGTEIYQVGNSAANFREVIGHYTTVNLLNQNLRLITEVDRSISRSQIEVLIAQISIPTIIWISAVVVVIAFLLNRTLTPRINNLTNMVQAVQRGDYDTPIMEPVADEIGTLATAFSSLRDETKRLFEDLTRSVQDRIRDVNVNQEISRAALSQSDVQLLMDQVVNLIRDRYPSIYHAQIFLIDEANEYAVLRASTGKVGQQLLRRGHRLGVGSVSVIGQVTQQGQIAIARDTATSNVHRRNEFLPDTRAELAVPLRLGNQVIGALDVQSTASDSFDDQQIEALQTLADQITIAIVNARLLEQSQITLQEMERTQQNATRYAWEDYMHFQRTSAIISQAGIGSDYDFTTLREQAIYTQEVAIGRMTPQHTVPFVLPLIVREQVIGTVQWEMPDTIFGDDTVVLAQEVITRLATTLENARLFSQSRRNAERERIVNTIATKITEQSEIEQILQTAVREVGQALQLPQVAIRLNLDNGHIADLPADVPSTDDSQ